MLFELRDHLRRGGPQTVADLEARLGMPAPVVRDMLERWMAKGRVARLDDGARCRRCNKRDGCAFADPTCLELYAWLEPETTPERRS